MAPDTEEDFNNSDIILKVVQDIQKRREEATAFLNGRDAHDLSEEEFDKLQEISGNNFYDKRNPDDVERMENGKIFEEREVYLKKVNDRSKIGALDDEFGLNLNIINKSEQSIGCLAANWTKNNLLMRLVNYTVFIHDRRKLHIYWGHAKIIAEPDEVRMTDESMNARGVTYWGRHAYDLHLHVTLDLREYENINYRPYFSFYFALKASQVEFSTLDKFLNYQLKETFKYDIEEFRRFLTLLVREKLEIPIDTYDMDNTQMRQILTVERVESISDWIASHDKTNPQTLLAEPEKLPSGWKKLTGVLTFSQIKDALSFLYIETFDDLDGKTFMTEEQFLDWIKYGIAYPDRPLQYRFHLNLSPKRNKGVLRHCFSHFFEKLEAPYGSKTEFACFLIYTLDEFKDDIPKSLASNLKDGKPQKMNFNYKAKYLVPIKVNKK